MAAIKKIADLTLDPEFIGYYDYEERKRADIKDAEETGFDKGFSQGKEEGIEQSKIEMVKKLFEKGIDISIISKCSGISREELRNVLNI